MPASQPSRPAARPGARSAKQRREDILQRATAEGALTVEVLAEDYGVTPSTIRRDLAGLHDQGLLARTYGGVISKGAPESSLPQRTGEAHAAKVAIAAAAVALCGDADSVLLDSGSTVAAMTPFLLHRGELSVVTPNLQVITDLAGENGSVEVLAVAGRLRRLSQSFVGPLAEATLERMHCDIAFLGADAITRGGQLCEVELEQTRLKEIMTRQVDRVVVLAHGAKLGRRIGQGSLQLLPGWTVLTDASAEPDVIAELRATGLEVLVAG
jgi:DeoR/GlpR family transcriptional regulator of sugar metabolism